MKNKVINSINNYRSALTKLHEFVEEPIVNDRDRAGIIQAFEFTFELAWKTFQKIGQDEGLEAGGPKTSLKQAFLMDLIKNSDENSWLTMLEDRNMMTHTYKENLSRAVTERIVRDYVKVLDDALLSLEYRYK